MLFALPLAAFLVDPGVIQAFPDDDVVLPTNARPVLLLESPAQGTMRVIDGDGVDVPLARIGTHFAATPALNANGTVTIATICEGCSGADVLTWQVGADDDVTAPAFADSAAIVIDAVAYEVHGFTSEVVAYTVSFDVPGVSEPHVLRLAGAGGPHVLSRANGNTRPYTFLIDGGAAREECFDVVAIDVAGNEGALAEPLCVTLDPANVDSPPSCAHANVAPLALALATLSRIRRRR